MWAAGALRGEPASTTRTRRRARDSTRAADRPAAPPPMITTSYLFMSATVRRSHPAGNKRCCFRDGGVEWGYGGHDRRHCDGAGPGRAEAEAAAGPARGDPDCAVGGDGHLEEHTVAPGDRAAPREPGAAAAAGPDVPCPVGRPGRRARGRRPTHPAQGHHGPRPHGAAADALPRRFAGLEDHRPGEQQHTRHRRRTKDTSGCSSFPAGCAWSSATTTSSSAPARRPSSTPASRTGSAVPARSRRRSSACSGRRVSACTPGPEPPARRRPRNEAGMTRPLMATKLYVPRLRRGLVARPRLLERLGRGAEATTDAGVRPGRVRQDDAAGRVAGRGTGSGPSRGVALARRGGQRADVVLDVRGDRAPGRVPGVGRECAGAPRVLPRADRAGAHHAAERAGRRTGRGVAGARRLPPGRRVPRSARGWPSCWSTCRPACTSCSAPAPTPTCRWLGGGCAASWSRSGPPTCASPPTRPPPTSTRRPACDSPPQTSRPWRSGPRGGSPRCSSPRSRSRAART